MATIIVRYANRANFTIRGDVDLSTNKVQIYDYLQIANDKLYYHDNKYHNEVVAVAIKDNNFRRALFGTHFYGIPDDQLEILTSTGRCYATGDYGSKNMVYAGKHFEPVAKKIGDKSLAECYARIEKAREQYREKYRVQNALLAVGSGAVAKHADTNNDTLAADIETFLKHRKKCLAALKPKKK